MENDENKLYGAERFKEDNCRKWYNPVNPNENVYTPGYGFSPHSPRLIERKMISACCAGIVMCLMAQFFISGELPYIVLNLFDRFFPPVNYPHLMDISYQLSMAVGVIGALTVPFLIYAKIIKMPRAYAFPSKGLSVKLLINIVFIALAVSVVGSISIEMFYRIFEGIGIHFYSAEIEMPGEIVAKIIFVLNITLIPAVFEELAFRGVVMQSLRRFGDGFALIVSSALFALVHVMPLQMPNAFLMGLVIGYFVMFTGSIYTGIIIHLVHNTLITAISQTTWLNSAELEFMWACLQVVYLVLGIISCIYMMKNYKNIFTFPLSKTANSQGQKLAGFFFTIPFFIFMVVVIYLARGCVV